MNNKTNNSKGKDMKLGIQNFQSLEGQNILDLEPGVNLIVGPSNSGKTAILRALRGLVLNYRGNVKKYLTHHKDQLQVDVAFNDDKQYTWIKDAKGKTTYIITDENGQDTNDKAGNDDIYSFDKNFPFVLRDKKLINTHTEKDGLPFPFDLNDVELFKVFEELYNVGNTAAIFKYMKKLETQTNSTLSNLKETLATNKKRIEAIIEVEDSYDLDKLEKLKNRAEAVQAGMIGLDEDIEQARSNNRVGKAIKQVLENAREFELNEISNQIKDINDLQKDIRIINSNNKIEQINVYKEEFNTAVIDAYKALSDDYTKAFAIEKDLKWLDEEEQEALEQLKELKDELAKIDVCPLCKQPLNKEE